MSNLRQEQQQENTIGLAHNIDFIKAHCDQAPQEFLSGLVSHA